jgi:hypothetical protein
MDPDLRKIFDRLEELFREDEILVQQFFLRLGETIPSWLVPGLLRIVITEARITDFQITLDTACSVDPDGNGPIWS